MLEPEFWDKLILIDDAPPINPEVADWFDSVLLKPTAPKPEIMIVYTAWQNDPVKP